MEGHQSIYHTDFETIVRHVLRTSWRLCLPHPLLKHLLIRRYISQPQFNVLNASLPNSFPKSARQNTIRPTMHLTTPSSRVEIHQGFTSEITEVTADGHAKHQCCSVAMKRTRRGPMIKHHWVGLTLFVYDFLGSGSTRTHTDGRHFCRYQAWI